MSSIELTKDEELEWLRHELTDTKKALERTKTELECMTRLFNRRQDFFREIEPQVKRFVDIESSD